MPSLPFELGCKFTWEYFLTGLLGSLVAVLVLPGCYTALPRFERVNGELRFKWGALARLVVGGIFGCVVDCNTRNAFFGGFFSWHICRWATGEGWQYIKKRLLGAFIETKGHRQ